MKKLLNRCIASLESQLREKEEHYRKLEVVANRWHNEYLSLELEKDKEIERLKEELKKWKNGPWMTPDGANSYIRTSNERQDKINELREALRELYLAFTGPDVLKPNHGLTDRCRKLIGE